ncbi:hypothetical protein HYW18_01240 [Candidatus Uhrbacteria bacterium]|nr:hypothetical protein [Candidatus Uhrbacteria bacterium]
MTFSEPHAFDLTNKTQNIHVVGASGVEGTTVLLFLRREGFQNIVGHALCAKESFEKEILQSHGLQEPAQKNELLSRVRAAAVPLHCDTEYLSGVEEADIIFVPQSWELYPENARLASLRERLRNVMQLYVALAPCKTIGVTGSDGKTTTAHLIWHILLSAGKPAWLSGNYRHGPHMLAELSTLDPNGFLVLEISNRHLNFGLPKTPNIAVITNVTQNHLTEYKAFDEYIETKGRILGSGTVAVLNADNPITACYQNKRLANRFLFSKHLEVNGACVRGEEIWMQDECLLSLADMPLAGEHNVENVLAAVTAVKLLGLSSAEIKKGVRTFAAVKERLQSLGFVDERELINDLSGTSMESTRRGVKAFSGRPLAVVLGGSTKGVDYAPLAQTLKEQGVVVCGVESEVADALRTLGVPLSTFNTAREALEDAHKKTPRGGAILVSPAGAFFASRYLPQGLEAVISSLQWRVEKQAQAK